MKNISVNFIGIILVLLFIFLFWKLSILFAYLFISIILAIVLNPLKNNLQKIMRLIYRVVSELFLIISPLIIIYRILKGKENLFRSTERYAIPSKKDCQEN